MPERIYSDKAGFLKNYAVAQERLGKAMSQLSTGSRLQRAGDESVAFEKVSAWALDKTTAMAQAQAVQGRISWYQSSLAHLSSVRDVLSAMSELAIQARGVVSSQDLDVLDANFQQYKAEIASITDGMAGVQGPAGAFNEIPHFMGFEPDVEVGADVPAGKIGAPGATLYTAYGRAGFVSMPLMIASDLDGTTQAVPSLSGTASAGTTTTITLDENAAAIDDVYKGLIITITGGAGQGQTATIDAYDAETRTATLSAPLAVALDATSQYRINDSNPNSTVPAIGNVTSVRFGEWVWGADNDRIGEDFNTFRALTADERAYRVANGVPATDLDAKTYAEKVERRMRNVFDDEYGNLLASDNTDRMLVQLENAVKQITGLMARQDAKVENLNNQYALSQKHQEVQDLGIDVLAKIDPYKATALLDSLSLDPAKIIELASRLSDNLRSLNDLVKNRGVR